MTGDEDGKRKRAPRDFAGLAYFLLLLLLLLGALAAKSSLIGLPEVRAASSTEGFSAERAAARLAAILGDERPHPTDTAASDAVRARLMAQLRAIGLQPQVRDQFACNELYKARGVTCARVRNIVATIGPAEGRHVLLSAHYDSNVASPGAGDAGVGVATLLELAALLKDRPLARPVTFLFNEGEELGLVGARAFLADPLSRRVDSLINLEARGVSGPANMFETSRPNAPAIAVFSDAVDRPVANSLSTDVYRLMPNYTDVNTFEERGWTTLNLAIIGNETRYHSPGDNLAALDRQSLQHMGDQALALALRLAEGVPEAEGTRIFMDVAGRTLVTLPLAFGVVLLVILIVALVWRAWRSGGIGRGLATVGLALIASAALGWSGEALLGLVRSGMFWRAYPIWMHLALYATAMAAALLLLATLGRQLDARRLRPAFWLAFTLIGAGIGWVAPGGIVYFLFPPLLAALGMSAARFWPPAERIGARAAIGVLYFTLGAMLGLLEELLNAGPMWIFAPLGLLLILPVLIETKPLLDRAKPLPGVAVGALLALLGWGAVAAAPAYSLDRQQMFVIEHVTDTATGKTHWSVINDRVPLPQAFDGLADWRFDKLPHSPAKRWIAEAPAAAGVTPPQVEIVRTAHVREGRRVTLRLRPNGATSLSLLLPKDAEVRAAGAGAFVRPIRKGSGRYMIRCFGRSCDGAELELLIGKAAPIDAMLVGWRAGLPTSAAPLTGARPRFARPQYSIDSTVTVDRVRI